MRSVSLPILPLETVLPDLGPIILAIVNKIQAKPEEPLSWYYRYILGQMIRNLERFIKPRVSVDAQAKADEMGIGDISRFQWRDQPIRMRDPDRKIFQFEHTKPVHDLIQEILCLQNPDLESIRTILSRASITWITKDEDRRLKRFRRSEDPLEDYARAGIRLLPE
jgi:hypothetical protein